MELRTTIAFQVRLLRLLLILVGVILFCHYRVEFRNQLVKKPDFKHSRVDSQRSCTAQSALSTSKGYTGDLHHDLSASRSSEAGGQDIPRVVPYVRKRPPKRQRTDEPS